jgi:hypothetical protein
VDPLPDTENEVTAFVVQIRTSWFSTQLAKAGSVRVPVAKAPVGDMISQMLSLASLTRTENPVVVG